MHFILRVLAVAALSLILLLQVAVKVDVDHNASTSKVDSVEHACKPLNQSCNLTSICMDPGKKEVCVITSSFAREEKDMDRVWNASATKKKDNSVGYYFFSNLDLNHSRSGWTNVKMDDLPYRRMITQSRVPKFMAWRHPIIKENCSTVFYLDASSHPAKAPSFLKFLHDLKARVLCSAVGFATPWHPKRKQTVVTELDDILRAKKDTQRNLNASLSWFREQHDYYDDIPVFANTYFMYSMTSQAWQMLMEDCFWKRYSLELDSWRDQPLFSYCVHHSSLKPVSFNYHGVFTSSGLGFGGHHYSEKDDHL